MIDEDSEFCDTVSRRFQRRGFVVRHATAAANVEPLDGSANFEICLLRLGLQTETQIAELRSANLLSPNCQIVLLTTREQLENASETIPTGVSDCLAKPLIWAELDWRIARAQERVQAYCRAYVEHAASAVPALPTHSVAPMATGSAEGFNLDTLATVQRAHILEVLRREGGNKARTARALGVNRRSLYRLIEKFKIELGTPTTHE